MNEGTQNQNDPKSLDTAATNPVMYGYCSWHHGHGACLCVISVQEQGSGPGAVQLACPSCLEAHGLVPFTDRP
ncbi:hypothetical protein SALBM135S_03417 [Streptomyces alboniger]